MLELQSLQASPVQACFQAGQICMELEEEICWGFRDMERMCRNLRINATSSSLQRAAASVGRLSDFGPLDAMPVDETEIVGSTFRFSSSGFIMDPLQAMNIEVFDFICLYKF